MAKVTITFEDSEKGVKVHVASDPSFDNNESTVAQHLGMKIIEYLNELHAEHGDEEDHCCGGGCHETE